MLIMICAYIHTSHLKKMIIKKQKIAYFLYRS